MTKRIVSIVIIFLCTATPWIVLSETTQRRTDDLDRKLRHAVGQLWGTKQRQCAPWAVARDMVAPKKDRRGNLPEKDAPLECTPDSPAVLVPLESSDISVDLSLEHRQKGLLWYSTYQVAFAGRYRIVNHSDKPTCVTFAFMFPSERALYDSVKFRVGEEEIADLPVTKGVLSRVIPLAAGASQEVEVSYITNGMEEWWYDFGTTVNQVKNFSLTMYTDFDKIDFPDNSISPTTKEKTENGWQLQWKYTSLLSAVRIGMAMPHKLNPGPWVSQVSYAAPVSLFLFFFVLFVVTTARHIPIHPMNYFFIGAAFFSFHLLLAYLVDHMSVHASFVIASAVSVVLVISYMCLVVGPRFAFVEVGLSQFVFLVLFAYSFFFQGYTGLTITILCIVTLFITMQITGRMDWDKIFREEKSSHGKAVTACGDSDSGSHDLLAEQSLT
jgi:inner membrane protein involved in colicin E2 resistance